MPVQDASESDSDSHAQEYKDGEALYYESIAPGLYHYGHPFTVVGLTGCAEL